MKYATVPLSTWERDRVFGFLAPPGGRRLLVDAKDRPGLRPGATEQAAPDGTLHPVPALIQLQTKDATPTPRRQALL